MLNSAAAARIVGDVEAYKPRRAPLAGMLPNTERGSRLGRNQVSDAGSAFGCPRRLCESSEPVQW